MGAALRAVFAGALGVVLAEALEADADLVRFAGALRVDADAARFAGALRVEPVAFDEAAEAFFAVGFLRLELERDELDFERLLGFFGVAMAADYSEGP